MDSKLRGGRSERAVRHVRPGMARRKRRARSVSSEPVGRGEDVEEKPGWGQGTGAGESGDPSGRPPSAPRWKERRRDESPSRQ
eukprot:evm.model.scf_515.9 EVM.evm.TU.scf_515.9   scf_515:69959-70205(-)